MDADDHETAQGQAADQFADQPFGQVRGVKADGEGAADHEEPESASR